MLIGVIVILLGLLITCGNYIYRKRLRCEILKKRVAELSIQVGSELLKQNQLQEKYLEVLKALEHKTGFRTHNVTNVIECTFDDNELKHIMYIIAKSDFNINTDTKRTIDFVFTVYNKCRDLLAKDYKVVKKSETLKVDNK